MNHLLLQKLKNQHREIELLLDGITPSLIQQRPLADKWSMQEHLAHLGRYQEVFLQRLLLILSKETPKLGRYRAENDPLFEPWRILELDEILTNIELSRQDLIAFFAKLSPEEWNRSGIHPVLGALSLIDWLQFFLLHENHHLYTLFKLRHTQSPK